jgi:hypothetical protein
MDHKLATSPYRNAPSNDDDARVHRNPIESLIITVILAQYLKARAHDILRTLLKLSDGIQSFIDNEEEKVPALPEDGIRSLFAWPVSFRVVPVAVDAMRHQK